MEFLCKRAGAPGSYRETDNTVFLGVYKLLTTQAGKMAFPFIHSFLQRVHVLLPDIQILDWLLQKWLNKLLHVAYE